MSKVVYCVQQMIGVVMNNVVVLRTTNDHTTDDDVATSITCFAMLSLMTESVRRKTCRRPK